MNRDARGQNVEFPEQFGNYQLVERLAVGGMAEIYRAKTTGIGGFEKVLVIKRLHDRLSQDDEFIDMMVDEARIAVRLNHPNIAKVFDLGRVNNQYYIAMEYIEGPDLSRLMRYSDQRGDRLPIPAVLYVGAETCAGLDFAHTRQDSEGKPLNIVHRDVSPPNIMLSLEGEVKIVDFGIAKARKRVQRTQANIIKGKFHYMAPEQAHGNRVDARTDVFSIGVVLYEMITGRNPYDGVDEKNMLDAVRRAEIAPLRQYRTTIDPELDQIIMGALKRNPDKRYRSAAEFERALSDYRERKCEPFDRRRLSDLVRDIWSEVEGGGEDDRLEDFDPHKDHAMPEDKTGALTPSDFEAGNSSVIYDAGEEHVLNQAGNQPAEGGGEDENPFAEDEPTQIWDGAEPDTSSGTQNALPPQRPSGPSGPSGPSANGEAGGRSTPDPGPSEPDRGRGRPLPPGPGGRGGGEEPPAPSFDSGDGKSPFHPSKPAELEPTPQHQNNDKGSGSSQDSDSSKKPLAALIAGLEEAGIDRRVQLYVGIALGLMLVTGLGIGAIALMSSWGSGGQQAATTTPAAGGGQGGAAAQDVVNVPVASEPSGAKVLVNGQVQGKTPMSLRSVTIGRTYDVTFEREGYEPLVRSFTPQSDSTQLKVELKKSRGVLRISTYPSDAKIELNGESAGYSPVTVTKLDRERTHEIVATLEDAEIEREVEWRAGDKPVKEVRMTFDEFEDEDEEEERSRRRHVRHDPSPSRYRDRNPPSRSGSGGGGTSGGSSSGSSSSGSSGSSGGSDGSNTDLFDRNQLGNSSGSSGGSSEESKEEKEGTNLDIWGMGKGEGGGGSSNSGGQNAGGKGYLTVRIRQGWGKVYVNDKLVSSETPLIKHKLSPGSHKVKVYYPVLKRYSEERTVNVSSGATVSESFSP